MPYQTISIQDYTQQDLQALSEHVKAIEKAFGPCIIRYPNVLVEANKEIYQALLASLHQLASFQESLSVGDVNYLIRLAKKGQLASFHPNQREPFVKANDGKWIRPKTLGQSKLVEALQTKTLVFALGPAGTGKTFLSIAHAVRLYKEGLMEKIILARPAVEAGESLGFLPGDMKEKVDPYLRPLYDGLHALLGQERVERLIEKEVIEIAPLAFMRGRTLSNAYVILDEAQNATFAQLKMCITRLGENTHMSINGDPSQVDLIGKNQSGLVPTANLLEGIDKIGLVWLSQDDVVRHPLVAEILARYEKSFEN